MTPVRSTRRTEDALLSYLSIGHHLEEELRRAIQPLAGGTYSIQPLLDLADPTFLPLMKTVQENADVALRDLDIVLQRKIPRPTREALDAERYPPVEDDQYDE